MALQRGPSTKLMPLLKNILSTIFSHASTVASAVAKPLTGSSSPTPNQLVDIEPILNDLAAKNPEKNLDWKKSIVDLMKLVGMDSSLSERKELAKELNYTADFNDSVSLNIWLHKEVLRKIAENGGKVPATLLH